MLFQGSNTRSPTHHIADYDATSGAVRTHFSPSFQQDGDPLKGGERIVDALKGEGHAKGRKLPTRLALGDDAFASILEWTQKRQDQAREWEEWSTGTNY